MSEHNHQPSDGPDYSGCPGCIAHELRMSAWAVINRWEADDVDDGLMGEDIATLRSCLEDQT